MILQRITDFILRGRVQAMGAAFGLAFIPLFGTFSIIIAAFVTLRKGIQEGALVLVAATLPVLLVYSGMPLDSQPLDAVNALDVVIMITLINVLTWLFACVLRKFTSWSWVLQLAGFLGVVAVIGLHIMYPHMQNWWHDWLTDYFTTAQQSIKVDNVAAAKSVVTSMVSGIQPYATGFFAAVLCFYAMLELLLARWWQDKIYNPGGLRKELTSIRMSYAASTIFIAGVVASLLGNKIAIDFMPILYALFIFAGLSLVHYIAQTLQKGWLMLLLVYTVLTLIPVSALLIAALALVDSAFDIRTRMRLKEI
jgi:hypothetical protein